MRVGKISVVAEDVAVGKREVVNVVGERDFAVEEARMNRSREAEECAAGAVDAVRASGAVGAPPEMEARNTVP